MNRRFAFLPFCLAAQGKRRKMQSGDESLHSKTEMLFPFVGTSLPIC
jgi:hypothetical protein